MNTSPSPLPIDVATLTDLPSILDLVGTEYRHPYDSAAFWHWRYFGNPVAEVAIYVARGPGGRIVAMQPVSAYPITVNGEACHAHMFTAAITHPDYRRQGLFRQLVDRIIADLAGRNDFLVFTFPNELSVQGFQRFNGWQQRELLSLYARPLWTSAWLKRRDPVSWEIKNGPSMEPRQFGALTVSEIQHFDQDTDRLLRTAFSNLATHIGRGRDYLGWRYVAHPAASYTMYRAERAGDLAGYIVLKASLLSGLPAGLVVDLVADDERTALALLKCGLQAARRRRLHVVGYLTGRFQPYRGAFLRAGFLPLPNRFLPRQFYLYTYPAGGARRSLAGAIAEAPWYITWGDTDVV